MRRDGAYRLKIVVRDANESTHQRLKTSLRLARTGGCQRGQSSAVPGVFHDDDLRARNAALVAVQARELDGAFVGFGTGISKKNIVHTRQCAHFVGECSLFRNIDQIRRVNDPTGLLGNAFHQLWVRMAQAGYRNPGKRIEYLATVSRCQPRAYAMAERDAKWLVGIHLMARKH